MFRCVSILAFTSLICPYSSPVTMEDASLMINSRPLMA